jgi:acyl transferase domain-containing protein
MSEHDGGESIASIAIIGMAGRFPGAGGVDAFWHNLTHGVESIRFFAPDELEESGIVPQMSSDPNFVRAKGFLSGADMFDAAFFGINAREAEIIDPQQRVFLECSWEALEAAGYDPEKFQGSIGVYAGGGMNTYLLSNILGNTALFDAAGAYQIMLASDKDFLSTRVSYKLNLKGPSLVIQTACSTSLVAVQSAYQALLTYQCDMALAGGVSIDFPQKTGYLYQEGMILSPDGHCRSFDAEASGTVGGEGVGIVVLKRLEDALQAGDNILAVIRGAAVNNDGSLKVGFSAPSVEGQTEVIATALAVGGIDPETVSYVEAHGTATPLGDPVEVAALTGAFRMSTSKKAFCALGSVKTNIGHLNAAAGVAGLIKTVLALQHRQIPASLHFQKPNPAIDFANGPFYVNDSLAEWKAGPTPRRAGVSSFGMGGSNAHVVLEEAPPVSTQPSRRTHHLLLLSARTPEALEVATDNLTAAVGKDPAIDLADAAYTLQTGRRHFEHRRVVVCRDRVEATELLCRRDGRRVFTSRQASGNRSVVFLLTGQGSQTAGMMREIYEREPVFRKHLDPCIERLTTRHGVDLRAVLFPGEGQTAEAEEQLRQTRLAQPAIFAVDYALAKLWMEWGVLPSTLLGHSLGEYVAACLAGVFSLEDALDLVAERGRLMQSVPTGAMLSVLLSRAALAARLGGDLSLAAVNAPNLCVASGPCAAIDQLHEGLKAEGINAQRLRTSHAFHSAMMDPIVDAFVAKVARIRLHPPSLPVMSNLTGTWLSAEQAADPSYWGRHLRNPVLFSTSVSELLADPSRVLLEVGPGRTLTSLAQRQAPAGGNHLLLSSLPHPDDQAPDSLALLTAMGRLWASGVDIDWRAFHAGEQRRRVVLPAYPFERKRFYVKPRRSSRKAAALENQPFKIQDLSRWFYVPSWRRTAPSLLLPRAPEPPAGGRWLLYLDDLGVGAALAAALEADGVAVTLVRAGSSFSRPGDGQYALDPREPGHYDALFADLGSRNQLPSRLVHLFTLTGPQGASVSADADVLMDRGFYSLLYSVQSLSKASPAHALTVDVVSNDSQDVSGGEPIFPEKAAMHGLSLVINQESGNLWNRNIDVFLPTAAGGVDGILPQLLAELRSGSRDPVIALRGEQRWIQGFEPLTLPAHNGKSRFRERGVYLITGGLGTIGLLIANHIAQRVRVRLVLTGRSGLPARSEWDSVSSGTGARSAVGRQIEAIRSIEGLGSEVLAVRADAADERDMQAVLRTIDSSFGVLHGVIHAAGAVAADDFAGIAELDRGRCQSQFRSKVEGPRVLGSVLRDRPLDFCLLTSSLSAVLGGLGFAAYASGNAFMDGFAHERNRLGNVPWISVNWDGWLRAKDRLPGDLAALAMTPEEGLETLDRITAAPALPQVIVSTGDLEARLRQSVYPRGQAEDKIAVRQPETTAFPEPHQDTDGDAFATKTEIAVAAIWKDVLGLTRIGPADDFFEVGGHSLLATQLLARIRATLGVRLPIRLLFEARTVPALAEAVEARLWLERPVDQTGSGTGERHEEFEL